MPEDDVLNAFEETDPLQDVPADLRNIVATAQREFNPATMISIRATTGGRHDIELADGVTEVRLSDLLAIGELATQQGVQYFVDNIRVEEDDYIALGSVVTAVGAVKGA